MLHIFTKSMAYSSQSLHVSFERQTSVWNINNKLVIFLLLTSWADSDTSTTCHHTDIGLYLISRNRYTGILHQLHHNHYIQYKQQVHTIISQVTAGVNHLRERVGHCVTHSCLMMMPTELVKKKKKKANLVVKAAYQLKVVRHCWYQCFLVTRLQHNSIYMWTGGWWSKTQLWCSVSEPTVRPHGQLKKKKKERKKKERPLLTVAWQ